MQKAQQKRYDSLYRKHISALTRQGKAPSTIDVYGRAVRRVTDYFDAPPDTLSQEQLEGYSASLVNTHSWSTVKVDCNGLQFFYKHILKRDWQWVDIVKPPQTKRLPDVLTLKELERLINGTRERRYQTFILISFSMGLCTVLHTHTSRLDYHPHVHIVVPGASLDRARRQWRKVQGRYLFNGRALAAAFRGALLNALQKAGLGVHVTPRQWVAHCEQVGRGRQALEYLARYLYRGVLSNRNIVDDDGSHVTFRYQDSQDRQWHTRTLTGENFLWLLVQHVLPKGFRRARDYGFLHDNAKALLSLLQWLLRVQRPPPLEKHKVRIRCPHCQGSMVLTGTRSARERPG